MAFDPLEERRRGQRGMLDLFGSSPLSGGGMLSAAGMPPVRAMGMSSPYMPSQTYPGSNPNRPMMFPTYQDAMDSWMANPSPGIDRPNPANWTTPSPTSPPSQTSPSSTGMLDPIEPQKSEAWWAAQPRPSFVPADWIYIGMGDWGPMDVYGPGGTDPRPTPSTQHLFPMGLAGLLAPKFTEAEIAAAYGSTTSPSSVQVGLPPGLTQPAGGLRLPVPPSDAS